MRCKARGACLERGATVAIFYCSRATARELLTASIKSRVVVLAPARTVTGLSFEVYSPRTKDRKFYCSRELRVASSRELPVVIFYCSRATARELLTASIKSRVVVLAPARTVKGATVVIFYCSRATARELLTASIKSHANSSHRSAYGGYSSNSKKFSLPLEQ